MGERRSRKLVWDLEDETKHILGMREHNSWSGKDHHGSGRYHEFSDSGASNSARDSRDQSGWPTWESVEEHPIEPTGHSFKNTYEAKDMGGGKRYHKNVSPGFEEMGGGKRYHKNVSPGFEEMGGGKRYHKNISPVFEEMGGGKRYHKNISPGFEEIGGGKRYQKNTSPGIEEMEVHNYNRTHEYHRSHSQRYMRKGRSRSRSRTRGRSRSRSLSKGRERDRGRERGRDWSRSRSESRSDGYVYTNDHRRSRSPIGDYRRQSHGWSDRRSGPEKSSQTCRDFTSGGCRKGSQCRFIHPTSISHRDSDFVEDDRVESWSNRSVYNQTPRHSYSRSGFESRNDVSDMYHGEDEQFLNRSRGRSSIPCRDFKAGICRWGDTCRFSHDFASAESYGQDSRSTTFNREDFDHQRYKNEKPLCKFFAAGKCSRDNCRFSHEDPNLNNLEGRLDNVTESQSSYEKNWWNAQKWDDRTRISNTLKPTTGWCEAIGTNTTSTGDLNNLEGRLDKVTESQSSYDNNWLNAPKWDDVTRISDIPKPTIGWGEAIPTDAPSTGDATDGQCDDRWGRNSNIENKIWGIQDHASNSLDSERTPSHPRESVCYVGDTGPAKSVAAEDMPNNQEYTLLHGVQLQNEDVISNLHGFSPVLENQSLTVERNVPPASHIQQHNFGETKSNVMSSFGSSVLDEVKDTRYTNHPNLLSGQSFNQNGTNMFPGQSSASKENDRVQNMLYTDLTNGHETDLKQHEAHAIKHLNVPIHAEIDKKAVLSPGYLESKVPQMLTNLLSRMHSDQVSNASVTNASQQVSSLTDPVSLIRSLVNERSQTYASLDVSSSKGTLPSFSSISGSQPLVSTTHVQDNVCAVSFDQSNSMGNNREHTEAGNNGLTQGTGLNNLMQVRRSSPSSIVGTGVESPKLKHPESPKQQGEVGENIGVTGDGKATGEESKGIHENKPSEDCEGKLEEGSANKDEKGLRLFKNSLVEFVKEILKPTWKEGRMSRDVHKTVVKKVVDKVSSTIQVEQIPKTQDKIDQYLSLSKPKITKLVQAYVERSRKADA